jgi:acyl carrier protein
MDTVLSLIMQLVQESHPDSSIKVERSSKIIDDLGLDSLDRYEMLFRLEATYNIVIPDEKAVEFLTVGDVCTYIENLF